MFFPFFPKNVHKTFMFQIVQYILSERKQVRYSEVLRFWTRLIGHCVLRQGVYFLNVTVISEPHNRQYSAVYNKI